MSAMSASTGRLAHGRTLTPFGRTGRRCTYSKGSAKSPALRVFADRLSGPQGLDPQQSCLYLQRFHPASPVILAVVTSGRPCVVRPFVGFQDHGVDPSPTQVDESLFRCFQQGGGDALPTAVRVYGQPVGGASPTIETGYDGSREKTVTLGEKQGFGVS